MSWREVCRVNGRGRRASCRPAVVALVAAGDEIFPRRTAAARTGQNVVESQLRSGKLVAAELAGIAVAQKNVLARKRPALLGNMTVRKQANHRRHMHGLGGGVHLGGVSLLGLSNAFQHEHQGAAHGGDVDRLEGSVQNQNRGLHHRGPACRCGCVRRDRLSRGGGDHPDLRPRTQSAFQSQLPVNSLDTFASSPRLRNIRRYRRHFRCSYPLSAGRNSRPEGTETTKARRVRR
jgi:hypothetical protein